MARKAVVLPLVQPGSVESADRVLAHGEFRQRECALFTAFHTPAAA